VARGNAEAPGGLFDRKAGVKPQLHQLRLGRIFLCERLKSFVQIKKIIGGDLREDVDLPEFDSPAVAAAFDAVLAAGVLDEDPPHGFGGGGKEMAPPVPAWLIAAADKAQVRFMDEGRGLEGLTGRLVRQPVGRQVPQLLINEREQAGGSLLVTGRCSINETTHVGHSSQV
jgi:hypothetical protein